jgi:uncharacterized protein YbbC (DUF1343 family)
MKFAARLSIDSAKCALFYPTEKHMMCKLPLWLRLFTLLAITIAASAGAGRAQEADTPLQQPAGKTTGNRQKPIVTGAARMELYLPLLKGKRVGLFANNTSIVGQTNLVDTLVRRGIAVTIIFGPEHGFRGTADAGEKVGNYNDPATGIPVVSLYGNKHRPSAEDLRNVDVMLFDIQDVGVRFYTYISSLQEYMEAAIENNKPLLLLDRPNPNGFYVDGPVLDLRFKSFVGMQPVPIVYGMTLGEYAAMLLQEGWLSVKKPANSTVYTDATVKPGTINTSQFSFTVIRCANYTHKSHYILPVKPSPNLPDMSAVYWYPSTCLFEGTILSEGRGTSKPFQLFGHPSLPQNLDTFTPRSVPGATSPKLKDQLCYGWDVSGTPEEVLKATGGKIQLKWLLEAYRLFPQKDSFFLKNGAVFNRLAGNYELMDFVRTQILEADIRKTWEPGLNKFRKIRKKYLLYGD